MTARRVLVVNPNSSVSCTAAIRDAVAPFALPGRARLDVVSLAEGPPAIANWRDWHDVAAPLCDLVGREDADAYVVACVSDPAIDLLRSTTDRPVFGALRSGIATAVARGERFGIIAFVAASVQRQRRVLQAMGLEARSVGSLPLDLPMEVLTSAEGPRARLVAVGQELKARGAEVVVLGCAGMAAHRGFVEAAIGLPVIEPCQAAAAQALLAVLG
ncbi:Hydantoin racemase [Rhodovastum atsumiense]|uniref:Asp/Glu racemase n=1 Tax=Rhodovastum atsumiense TaxID=504468 RepID=A0A5M6IKW6_9PROT|nr:aspartate/glutamate racemase family protein [Rhodovastum atsumiense]KAA5608900.1 Asp/Glu racemase [Rhodovastum atsumiense]CAH2602289.1 Hydantoin racemase [Rhodovastum atsumiense]